MSLQNKEKFNQFIESLVNKQITCEQLLRCLNKNRFKLYSNVPNESDLLADLSLNSANTPNQVFNKSTHFKANLYEDLIDFLDHGHSSFKSPGQAFTYITLLFMKNETGQQKHSSIW